MDSIRRRNSDEEDCGGFDQDAFEDAWFIGVLGESSSEVRMDKHGSQGAAPAIGHFLDDMSLRRSRLGLRALEIYERALTFVELWPSIPFELGATALISLQRFGWMVSRQGVNMAKFKVGDVVVLNSGSPRMTIAMVGPTTPPVNKLAGVALAADEVVATWFQEQTGPHPKPVSETFNEAILTKK